MCDKVTSNSWYYLFILFIEYQVRPYSIVLSMYVLHSIKYTYFVGELEKKKNRYPYCSEEDSVLNNK